VRRKRHLAQILALLAGVATFSLFATATAQERFPQQVVRQIYQLDKAKEPLLQNPKLIERYFDSRLAALLKKDLSEHKAGGMGLLDFDPLYDGQDTEITALGIDKPMISGDHATVLVRFKNFGEPKRITFRFNRSEGQWKVQNIIYPSHANLVDIMSSNQSH
jgi:Protein of unknown function (DUF3828)